MEGVFGLLRKRGPGFRVEGEVGLRPQELTQDCKLVIWAVFDWLLNHNY